MKNLLKSLFSLIANIFRISGSSSRTYRKSEQARERAHMAASGLDSWKR
jgi:hypothetical protein